MRVLVIVGYEQDPADEYLLAPEGLNPVAAGRVANALLNRYLEEFDYDTCEECRPIDYLIAHGFDIAEWIRAEVQL